MLQIKKEMTLNHTRIEIELEKTDSKGDDLKPYPNRNRVGNGTASKLRVRDADPLPTLTEGVGLPRLDGGSLGLPEQVANEAKYAKIYTHNIGRKTQCNTK
jgi:hypothetical protein